MGSRIDNRKDILLLLLYSPGKTNRPNEPIEGRTRLVKMLFLFQQEAMAHFRANVEISDEKFYEFFPWNFGPFSSQVYDDLTFFMLRGFIESEEAEETLPESAAEWEAWLSASSADADEDAVSEYNEEVFRLTSKGVQFALELYSSLTAEQQELLRGFKKRLNSAPLRAIIKYVYETYPEMTDRSTIREEILGSG